MKMMNPKPRITRTRSKPVRPIERKSGMRGILRGPRTSGSGVERARLKLRLRGAISGRQAYGRRGQGHFFDVWAVPAPARRTKGWGEAGLVDILSRDNNPDRRIGSSSMAVARAVFVRSVAVLTASTGTVRAQSFYAGFDTVGTL